MTLRTGVGCCVGGLLRAGCCGLVRSAECIDILVRREGVKWS